MNSSGQALRRFPYRAVIAASIAVVAYAALLCVLRASTYMADPLLSTYLDMAGSLIAFTFAANAMMRFRGTHDRISLMLAFGFVLAGLIEAAMGMTFYRSMLAGPPHGNEISLGWFAGRTLLGVVLLAALFVEKRMPVSREPGKEIAAATMIVGAVAYLTSAFYFMLPRVPKIQPHSWMPRPWDLLPAAIYIAATIGYGRRLRKATTWLDRSLFLAAGLNVICHITISQSEHMLDACYWLGHVLMVMSYVVVLGGTLLDNAQLFDQVSRLAASDSLTGLANHRHMIEVLEGEIERSKRTGRSFAVLLFDLDGLKKINDKYGHLVGSRAIKRVGDVLSGTCRAIDTPARYGGDEFALVLPESGEREAEQAATRICDRLQNDGEEPKLAISMGQAVYPMDGTTIEQLLGAADTALYQMKGMGQKKLRLRHVAACL
ncbi:MAG: GGDEF domain-containing protein [Acidobacteriota bacterium]|nr:GGDEF domain-containing protein [Acidobacteriota bacterium]MDE3171196.1 GGDEF domain-containing protein [Acidobacteriota bacterium]